VPRISESLIKVEEKNVDFSEVLGRIVAPSMPAAPPKDWVRVVADELMLRYRETQKDVFGTSEVKVALEGHKAPVGTVVPLKTLADQGYAVFDHKEGQREFYKLLVPGTAPMLEGVELPDSSFTVSENESHTSPVHVSQPNTQDEKDRIAGQKLREERDAFLAKRTEYNAAIAELNSQEAKIRSGRADLVAQVASLDCEIEEREKYLQG
jgi:hypothetical protein